MLDPAGNFVRVPRNTLHPAVVVAPDEKAIASDAYPMISTGQPFASETSSLEAKKHTPNVNPSRVSFGTYATRCGSSAWRMQLLSHRVQQQQLDRLVQRVTRDKYEVSRGVQHPSTVPHASCDVKKRQVTSHLQDGTCRLSISATQRMQRATRRLQNLFAITLISCVGLGFKFY